MTRLDDFCKDHSESRVCKHSDEVTSIVSSVFRAAGSDAESTPNDDKGARFPSSPDSRDDSDGDGKSTSRQDEDRTSSISDRGRDHVSFPGSRCNRI